MDFGYKTLLALTLATAACWRAKAQDSENKKDSVEIKDNKLPEAQNDSTILIDATRQDISGDSAVQQNIKPDSLTQNLSEKDAKIEEICNWIVENKDCVNFIVHFEGVKMDAYFDKVAKKWTIGFGNLTRPDGKPVRKGDKIKDEAELMHYFAAYFRKNVAPTVVKYVSDFLKLEEQQKIILVDLFWNAGSGQGVLLNRKEYDTQFAKLPEEKRHEVAKMLREKNETIEFEGRKWSIKDLPEWRSMSSVGQMEFLPIYNNDNVIKGYKVNHAYAEKFRNLDYAQREEVSALLLEMKAKKTAASKPYAIPHISENWNLSQINDSTIRYQGYVTEQDFTLSDVPAWYKLNETKQEQIYKKLAERNGSVMYEGQRYSAKDIPLWYFLDEAEQKATAQMLNDNDILYRSYGEKKNKSVLANLGLAINACIAADDAQKDVAVERVAALMISYTRSCGKVIPALQKRAFMRAAVFSNKIKINGVGENSIDLSSIFVGASYQLKVRDLNNPIRMVDTITKCPYGKNVADTIRAEVGGGKKYPQNIGKRGKVNTKPRGNTRTVRRVTYGR